MTRRTYPFSLPAFLAMIIAGGGAASVFSAAAQDATPGVSPAAAPAQSVEVAMTDVSGAEIGAASFNEASDDTVAVSVRGTGFNRAIAVSTFMAWARVIRRARIHFPRLAATTTRLARCRPAARRAEPYRRGRQPRMAILLRRPAG